jgi:ribose transport system substrate-binding protein
MDDSSAARQIRSQNLWETSEAFHAGEMIRGVRRLGAMVVALALSAAACGDGDGGDGPRADADVCGAEKQLDRFKRLPRFRPPGPAFDAARTVRGKKIFEIPITSEVPFVTAFEQGMRQATDAVGAELVVYKNQGEPSQWIQGIRAAIAQDADAITLLAQDPGLLGPHIAAAEREGVPVIVLRTTGEGEPCQADPDGDIYGTACVPGPFEQAGRLEADRVIAASGGDANVLVITSNDARSTRSLVSGMKDEFRTRCPGCEARYVDVAIPDWAREVRGEVQSALVRDPAIDWVIPIYDSMSQYVAPAIKASGKAERVRISTFNGTPFVLEMMQDDDIVQADVGENLSWIGWASMDQTFRVIAGEKPLASENTPLRVFDDSNVAEAGDPPELDRGYGRAYVEGYKRLWRVSD